MAVDHSKIKTYPVIVKAMSVTESKEAVPTDVIEILSKNDDTVLVLPEGEYKIVLMDTLRKEIVYPEVV